MNILRPVDIENEVRLALNDYFEVYCRPLPKTYNLPNILVEQTGGSTSDTVDTFQVKLSVRAKTDGDAIDTLRTALGTLAHGICREYDAYQYAGNEVDDDGVEWPYSHFVYWDIDRRGFRSFRAEQLFEFKQE